MTDPEDSPLTSEQAVKRGWARLRRKIAMEKDNPEEKTWLEINDRNNFGPGFFCWVDELGKS